MTTGGRLKGGSYLSLTVAEIPHPLEVKCTVWTTPSREIWLTWLLIHEAIGSSAHATLHWLRVYSTISCPRKYLACVSLSLFFHSISSIKRRAVAFLQALTLPTMWPLNVDDGGVLLYCQTLQGIYHPNFDDDR